MKYRVGQTVRVKENCDNNFFDIGEIFVITEVDESCDEEDWNYKGDEYWIYGNEIELVIDDASVEKPKRYEIETIEQLINISTVENYERLGIDFLLWLNYVNQTFAKYKKNNPNVELPKVDKFIWIDDGKNEIKHVELRNTTNGEVTTHEVKNKITSESKLDKLFKFTNNFIREFEDNYVIDNGEIVDNPNEILKDQYLVAKEVINDLNK